MFLSPLTIAEPLEAPVGARRRGFDTASARNRIYREAYRRRDDPHQRHDPIVEAAAVEARGATPASGPSEAGGFVPRGGTRTGRASPP